ncbi:S-methyl-5-thioribose-1-phosphate isomerase [Natranaerobius thermophilus JW/NM-WN-LF]|nr:S-methyl-5-thioribose-1-phosphate isomerase [Natranaerobius thermophilus]
MKPLKFEDDELLLLDQRKLPGKEEYFTCKTYQDVHFAIKEMVCRGAPLIGAVGAYGVALACREFINESQEKFQQETKRAISELSSARPTAVNLFWALNKMNKLLGQVMEENTAPEDIYPIILNEAHKISDQELQRNYRIAEFGDQVISNGDKILTHCNTGALATTGYGTALGVIRQAHYNHKDIFVYVDETRPRLQGAKLTAWELKQEQLPFALIPDSSAAVLIKNGDIDVIFVGADRIASNGDTANKIGTFMLSILAKKYKVPFYVVAPVSTIDFQAKNGDDITIEERSSKEVTEIDGVRVAPTDIQVYNPAFDITPAENITGIITEKGIIGPNNREIMTIQE